jgi:hypothetical protein
MNASKWIDDGLRHATIALELEPENPDALELRGTLRYWRWLLNLEPDDRKAGQLFANAESDLRAAIAIDANQAGAWAALSHLVLNRGATAEGKMAAQRAYEADAYLRSADLILWRLFSTSYDLQDQVDATRWCAELRTRFPAEQRAAECELWVMTMHEAEPDVDRAWQLSEEYVALGGQQTAKIDQLWSRMAVAAVLARSGLADSARAVASRSHGNADVDPTRDLIYAEAFVRAILGDTQEALDLLTEYMAVAGRDPSELDFWWFDSLRDEPRYQLITSPQN